MVCIVSGVLFQGWDSGTLGNTLSGCVTQDPRVAIGASRGFCYSPPLTLMCVCVDVDVCIRKAHFPSSPRSVVSLARLSRGASESLASETTRSAQLSLHSCVVVLS